MNCATHNDTAAVAFCRTCGKPLCGTCTRDVRGVIYCEPCLAARLEGTAPAAGFVPPQTTYQPVVDPGLAPENSDWPEFRPQPCRCWHPRWILSLRRGCSVLLAIRQRTGASIRFCSVDLCRQPRTRMGGVVRHQSCVLLRLSNHRRRSHRQGHTSRPARTRSHGLRASLQHGRQIRYVKDSRGRCRSHRARPAFLAAHHGHHGVRLRTLLAADSYLPRRLDVLPPPGECSPTL